MTRYACPECGSTAALGTLEQITGIAWAEFHEPVELIVAGHPETNNGIDHLGETEVNWDSSTSIGFACGDCGWEQVTEQPHAEVLAAINEEDDRCSDCNAPLDDGEGWDGKCGPCADRAARAEDDQ